MDVSSLSLQAARFGRKRAARSDAGGAARGAGVAQLRFAHKSLPVKGLRWNTAESEVDGKVHTKRGEAGL